ncbi:MAG: DUF6175 family protein [Candidatus Calescibacterium sp.]|nr:DUF6175 family protein [Candidatus Calescibacterium sp.]MCX7733293.1 DUF6175 family protein [bacterium]MDW8086785.1 DUF6175 family protein [Candidatus Calescibacterium sp.]
MNRKSIGDLTFSGSRFPSYFLIFLISVFFVSCAKSLPKYPYTYDAQIITSLDPETVQVRSSGTWDNGEGALLEAKMNAVWAVIQTLAQTDQEKLLVERNKERIYSDIDRFVMVEGSPRRKQTPEGKINIEITAVVRKKLLEESLVSAGYIQKREEIIEILENPSIVVIPSDAVKNENWAEFVANEVNSYLTTRKFEVLNPDTLDKLYNMAGQIEALEGLPQDPTAKIALSVGSDIYITFEGKFEEKQVGKDKTVKAVASLKAFETTTGRLIGSSTGFSKELVAGPGKDRVTMSEAVRDAVDKVLTQVMDYWKSDIKKGKQFLIMLYGDFTELERQKQAVDSIKEISSDYKREVSTKNLMTFRIWFKGKSDEVLFDLQDKMSKRGMKISPVVQNRKMLQIRVSK